MPPQLCELAQLQSGVLSRAQILQAGLTRGVVTSQPLRGSWQRLHPGVFAFSGPPARAALLWAAVLAAGPGATLSHQTAAEVWQLADVESSPIHVTMPGSRRVRGMPGIVLHLSGRASQSVHPARTPPVTRIEETVIDLWQAAGTLDEAFS